MVRQVVKKGADPHQASYQGLTPLHIATFEATGTLSRAGKCCGAADADFKIVYYCCKACQVKDWKEGGENSHKIQCKRLIEIKERYMEQTKKEIEIVKQHTKCNCMAGKAGDA